MRDLWLTYSLVLWPLHHFVHAESGCSKAEWGDARTASDGPLVCARIYPNKYCTGYPLLLGIESHIPDLKSISAAVSSREALALVRPGCKLDLWSGRDYTGRQEESFKTRPWKVNMRGKLSASCTCTTNNTEILTCKPKEVWSLVKRCDFTEYDYGGKCTYPAKFGYDLSSLYGHFEDSDKEAMTSVVEAFMGSNGEELHTQENAEVAPQFVSMDVPAGGEVSIFRKAYYCGEYRLATPEIKVKSGRNSQSGTVESNTGLAQMTQCSSYVPKSQYSGQGTVTSPNYPKSYAPNAFVNYPLVAAASNGTIKLRISDFKTEEAHDKLYIQNGLHDPHMEILSGVHNDTLVYRSTGPIMMLTFVTDNNVELKGWYATFTTEYA